MLFEICFEVADKIGGLYTAVKTKVPVTIEEYGNNVYGLNFENLYYRSRIKRRDKSEFFFKYLNETTNYSHTITTHKQRKIE